jgi:hypothetical protein
MFQELPNNAVAPADRINEKTAESFLVQLPASPFEYRPRLSYGFDWGFIIFFTFLLLLAFIKGFFLRTPKISSYGMLLKKTYNKKKHNQEWAYPYFSSFPFVVCSWIIFSMILYTFIYQSFGHNDNIFLLWSFGFMLVFFIVRFILFKCVGILFKMKDIILEFGYLTKTINFFIAFLSFPVIFINYYYPHLFLMILMMLIFVVLSLYRMISGWEFLKQKFKVHEYFLYLCTIEILPVLILLKFMSNNLLAF